MVNDAKRGCKGKISRSRLWGELMSFIEKTGKTVDEAVEAALKELNVLKEQVNIEVVEESSKKFFGLFGKQMAKVRVSLIEQMREAADKLDEFADQLEQEPVLETSDSDNVDKVSQEQAVEMAKDFLQNIFKNMQLEVLMEKLVAADGVVTFHLHGKDLGILIGKHGQTLDSLQYITNLIANKNSNQRVRIVIDVENYRSRRVETLTTLAKRLASKVRRTGERVVLEPMNPHERKVIHLALQEDRRIVTNSEGEEPYRYVVIELKK